MPEIYGKNTKSYIYNRQIVFIQIHKIGKFSLLDFCILASGEHNITKEVVRVSGENTKYLFAHHMLLIQIYIIGEFRFPVFAFWYLKNILSEKVGYE